MVHVMQTSQIKNPISILQEYSAKKGLPLPLYEFIDVPSKTGASVNEYHCKVYVKNISVELSAVGTGPSKATAKQNAAIKILELLNVAGNSDFNSSFKKSNEIDVDKTILNLNTHLEVEKQNINYIGQLYELCSKLKLTTPIYSESTQGAQAFRRYKCECKLDFLHSEASALRKKEAKQLAFKIMLEKVKDKYLRLQDDKMKIDGPFTSDSNSTESNNLNKFEDNYLSKYTIQDSNLQINNNSITPLDINAKTEEIQTVANTDTFPNYIGLLNQICDKLKISHPVYAESAERGPDFVPRYSCGCHVDSLTARAVALKKKDAKYLAAKSMIDELKRKYNDVEFNYAFNLPQKKIEMVLDRKKSFVEMLRERMTEKNLSFEDLQKYITQRDEGNLKNILKMLDIPLRLHISQERPPIATAELDLGTPTNIMAIGSTEENAKINLISHIYHLLDVYLGTDVNSASYNDDEEIPEDADDLWENETVEETFP